VCEWFVPELTGYQRRIAVSDGQDLQPWILEMFGSGKYRFAQFRGSRSAGFSPPGEILSAEHPQKPHRQGGPMAPLPAGPAALPIPPAQWGAPSMQQQPTWIQLEEMRERAAERERQQSAERLAMIRADEDDRRARREREDDERRRRDLEDAERRAAQEKERAKAEMEAMRERYKLEMERSKQEHEMALKRLELERERDTPADDFARLLEEAEERIVEKMKANEPPKSELMQFLGPHMPTLIGIGTGLAKAAQEFARRPPAPSAAPPVYGDPNAPPGT